MSIYKLPYTYKSTYTSTHTKTHISNYTKTYKKLLLLLSILFGTNAHASIITGDLLITEVLTNPSAVSDTSGEWFEIVNTTDHAINLNGMTIKDNGSNFHTINSTLPLIINPGNYFVLGRNDDPSENGNYQPDYVYSSFTLSNSSDEIFLEFENTIIDSLIYNSATLFGVAGNSVERTPTSGFQLTPSEFIFGDGDIGTPGIAGSFSPTLTPTPIASVPEPTSGLLMLVGLIGLIFLRKTT